MKWVDLADHYSANSSVLRKQLVNINIFCEKLHLSGQLRDHVLEEVTDRKTKKKM